MNFNSAGPINFAKYSYRYRYYSYRYRYKCLAASSLLGELIRSAHNSVEELGLGLGLLPGREGICYAKPITGHRSCLDASSSARQTVLCLASNLFLEHLEVYIMRCNLSKLSVSRPAATVCQPVSLVLLPVPTASLLVRLPAYSSSSSLMDSTLSCCSFLYFLLRLLHKTLRLYKVY